ncbi:hypothetical protein DLJ47_18125 [Micromonospora sp. S4605]|uniref:hypothetical protein n=1 Tax=Micromonospora sp. S4605 TaxID=1420897 RepID=UPI000D6F376F|nr:hypothetical protein [Micromonospora sp. S4605]PWU52757.1 hypothetical protein DLJ47_18125 [Micromonospora sp. S4605]
MDPQFDAGIDSPADTSPTPTTRRRMPAWVTRSDTWFVAGVLTVAAALAAGALWLLWKLLTGILAALDAGGEIAGDAGHAAANWVATGPITRTITAPVHAYLDSHAAGLPATAEQLRWGWLITGVVLLTAASFGARGARIGWCLHGVSTAAMVWSASPADNRELAVAVTAAVWSLLAVPAFARGPFQAAAPRHTTVVITRPTGADSAESATPAR